MSKSARQTRNGSIDPAMIQAVVREVIARLRASSNTNQAGEPINDAIVTASSIEQLSGKPSRIVVLPSAIVTPAATDAARRRGITIHRSGGGTNAQQPRHAVPEITDSTNPARGAAIRAQVARRGKFGAAARILLSDTPARDVYRQCVGGEVAVMIASFSDVDRFADELTPTVWVLDMNRLNIPSAVNVITRALTISEASR